MPQSASEYRIRFVQHKLDVIIVDLFHLFNQLIEADIIEVFVAALRHIMVRMIRILSKRSTEKITSSALKSRVGLKNLLLLNFTP